MFVMIRNASITNRSYTHVMHDFVTNICTRHVQSLQRCIALWCAGGGVEGERMPGVKKHREVPRPEGVVGIWDSGDGHTPVTTQACEVVLNRKTQSCRTPVS